MNKELWMIFARAVAFLANGCTEAHKGFMILAEQSETPSTASAAPSESQPTSSPDTDAKKEREEREEIVAKLKELGVNFRPKAATKTLKALLGKALIEATQVGEPPAEEPKEEPAEKPKEEPKEKPKEKPKEEPKEEPAEEPKEDKVARQKEALHDLLKAYSVKHGREKTMALLGKFEAKKLSDVKPDKYSEFHKALTAEPKAQEEEDLFA